MFSTRFVVSNQSGFILPGFFYLLLIESLEVLYSDLPS